MPAVEVDHSPEASSELRTVWALGSDTVLSLAASPRAKPSARAMPARASASSVILTESAKVTRASALLSCSSAWMEISGGGGGGGGGGAFFGGGGGGGSSAQPERVPAAR